LLRRGWEWAFRVTADDAAISGTQADKSWPAFDVLARMREACLWETSDAL
jgi:hypothetical protein